MGDYVKPENLIEEINKQAAQLHTAVCNLIGDDLAEDTAKPDDIISASQSLITLLTIGVASLAEISISLNHIANQANRDFEAAVKAAAEDLATVKHEETTKRSFIGKKT